MMSTSRRIAAPAFALLIPVLFFALLEAGLRFFQYGPRLDLFVPADGAGARDYLQVNPDVARRYFPRSELNFLPRPANDRFRLTKRDNGYRIFVMGESTTEGWPYPSGVMFSRLLWRRVSAFFPNKDIEVVNTGITAMNSYALRDFVDEILEQHPDAILIYAGHNEYFGALGVASTVSLGRARWAIELNLWLRRFKTFLLVRDFVDGLKHLGAPPRNGPDQSTLMGRVIGDVRVPYASRLYQSGKEQFQRNLADILERARRAGVPVVLSEVVSNIRDQPPLASIETPSFPRADAVYRQAQSLEAAHDLEGAKKSYTQAKDLDALRFRAAEDINRIIHALADRFALPVVPMVDYFERRSPNRLMGNTLFLEHLHPNTDGYLLMSRAALDTLRTNGFISRDWPEKEVRPFPFPQDEQSFGEIDRAVGRLAVVYLRDHWPFTSPEDSGKVVAAFQPQTEAESLALRYLTQRMSLKNAYLQMAGVLMKEGKPAAAAKELQGLVNTWPYDVTNYLEAADRLIGAGRDDDALPFLYQSLAVEQTGPANRRLGEVLARKQRYKEALPFLESARTFLPDDPDLLAEINEVSAASGRP